MQHLLSHIPQSVWVPFPNALVLRHLPHFRLQLPLGDGVACLLHLLPALLPPFVLFFFITPEVLELLSDFIDAPATPMHQSQQLRHGWKEYGSIGYEAV